MEYSCKTHQRRSIRIKDYDYSQTGLYFVTICVQNKRCLFGQVNNENCILNDAGEMITKWYFEIQNKFQNIYCLEHIVMPNHIHFILDIDREMEYYTQNAHSYPTLSDAVRWFKTMTTNEYIRQVKVNNWLPFDKRLWQRNYYEHIIRNERSYNEISDYIVTNPISWQTDVLYNTD
ncbi:TPA: transposase [Pasteurella multocida]|nr:transposase [Pasteurella multocida]